MQWDTGQAVIEGYYDYWLKRESAIPVLLWFGEEELAESYQEGWDHAAETVTTN